MLISLFEGASNRAISVKGNRGWSAAGRVIFATVRESLLAPETAAYFSVSLSLAYDNHGATNGQHANRSRFICCALPAGLQFLGWRQRRNCRDQGRYDYQASASARRGVEIRRRVAG